MQVVLLLEKPFVRDRHDCNLYTFSDLDWLSSLTVRRMNEMEVWASKLAPSIHC